MDQFLYAALTLLLVSGLVFGCRRKARIVNQQRINRIIDKVQTALDGDMDQSACFAGALEQASLTTRNLRQPGRAGTGSRQDRGGPLHFRGRGRPAFPPVPAPENRWAKATEQLRNPAIAPMRKLAVHHNLKRH